MSTVLVTGGSGFIASHTIAQLLATDHQVRTTVRSAAREGELRSVLKVSGDRLSFFVADLERDAGWKSAVMGCDYVVHTASPLPRGVPRHEDELIVPAREGALRVLRAARDAGVRRVVMTSSFAAIGYGHEPTSTPFNEEIWTDPTHDVSAYVKSKTVAERAAWTFVASEGGSLELSVVNPVLVLGPALSADYSTSLYVIKRMLDGGMPGCPKLYFGIVDVRDVADLHLRCMTHPAAKGQRFLATAGNFLALVEVAQVLKARMGPIARKVPTHPLPGWLVRLGSLVNAQLRQMLPEVGKVKNGSNAKARGLLGWTPRSSEEAIVATAESFVQLGLLR
jgi:nucleoside-diphosphate-sugar epimerase